EPHHERRGRDRYPPHRHAHLRARMRHCRHRRQRLHHDRLDRADGGPALHRRHLPGDRLRRSAEPARHGGLGIHDLAIAIDVGVLPHRLDGEGADPADGDRTAHAAPAGAVRPQGQKVTVAMPATRIDSRMLELIGFALVAALILLVLPLMLDIFRLNLVGKYLTYAFVAVGLVLCWGHTGILSLGQGAFFGLGGYCMAAFLKLEASSVANTKIQSTPGIPDFMDWNQITELPFFWIPFKSLPFTLLAVIVVP